MLPAIIEDLIKNVTDKTRHVEKRQFYYLTLLNIQKSIGEAISKYETEKNIRVNKIAMEKNRK